jgi:DNA polymerase III subunit delta
MPDKITPTYHVLHGKNALERAEHVRVLRDKMGKGAEVALNIREFYAPDCTVAEIIADVSTYPFLHDRRLDIVYDLLTTLGAGKNKAQRAELDKLVAALPGLPEYARLVFVEQDDLPQNHPVLKLMQTDNHGFGKQFNPPPNVASWITRRVAGYEAEIEPAASNLLASWIGTDLYTADNEIAKLVAYTRGERMIKAADVHLLSTNTVESKVWDLAALIGSRRSKAAMALLHKLIEEGSEPIPILGMIYSQYRQLMMVKAFSEEGVNGQIAEQTGLQSWQIGKLREQVGNYSYAELEAIHRMLLDTDYKVKTGQISPVLALDLLVANFTN